MAKTKPKQKRATKAVSRSRKTAKARPPEDFDLQAYLASVPDDARTALESLCKAIRAAAPRAVEGRSYGVPAFRLDGRPLVCFAAAARHCSLYPMSGAVMRAHAAELERYDTSRGTIRFPPDKPLPASLVRKLVKARVAELEAAAPRSRKPPAKPRVAWDPRSQWA